MGWNEDAGFTGGNNFFCSADISCYDCFLAERSFDNGSRQTFRVAGINENIRSFDYGDCLFPRLRVQKSNPIGQIKVGSLPAQSG